jgi:putative N6-adenine-specific DNA methylase
METYQLIAKTFQGLEEVLAQELTALGANDIEIGRRMVSFTGDKAMMYRANFCLRTAIRILKPIRQFKAKNADEVYEYIKSLPWEEYLDVKKSFAVDAVVFGDEFRHSKFVSYKVKDAIVDYFREKTGKRPSVRINRPDIQLHIHIAQTSCTLALDSSGESLHRRGYRQEATEAPLNEVLAAGMILLAGWHGQCDLIDPMCGSGTIPIEAALIARNIAPGVFRKEFAFERWADFDADLFDEVYNDDSQERPFEHKIYAYDNSPKANEIARHNIKAAGVSKDVVLKQQAFQQFTQPEQPSLIITNPPYGERITSDDLLGLYAMIGERLKHAFVGNTAWVISYREECFDEIALKATTRIPLYNGALECEFRRYDIFDGKYKEHKEKEGREEKTLKELQPETVE